MTKYGINLGNGKVHSSTIGLSVDNVFIIEGDSVVLLGTSVERTRKGFYYYDIFFKRQFVPWSLLVALD